MVEFKRRRGESFESFLRRFNNTMRKNRKLNEVRRRRFMPPKETKVKVKESKLVSMKLQKKKEYLKKIGKIKDEPRHRR